MRKLCSIKSIMLLTLIGISTIMLACSVKFSESKLNMSFSQFTGEKVKEINLNSDDNALSMSGKVKIQSGTVDLFIKVKETDEVLYSYTITKENDGNITIDIPDLNDNRDLLLTLQADSAKDFKLSLTSHQKLNADKEKPEK